MTNELLNIISQILTGEHNLMLHNLNCMSIFQESGYHGFKRMFECFAYDRFSHITRLKKFLGDSGHIYPKTTVSFQPTAFNGVIEILQTTHDTVKNHIVLLQDAASKAIDDKEHRLMGYLEYMVKDQSDNDELLKCFRMIEKIKNTGSDKTYLQELDCELHEKYKKRLNDWQYKDWR